jgi:hypothetical protein
MIERIMTITPMEWLRGFMDAWIILGVLYIYFVWVLRE